MVTTSVGKIESQTCNIVALLIPMLAFISGLTFHFDCCVLVRALFLEQLLSVAETFSQA